MAFDIGAVDSNTGPLEPVGGVDWDQWTAMDKAALKQWTGCTVVFRQRSQWGLGKKVVAYGPALRLQDALNAAIDILRSRGATAEQPTVFVQKGKGTRKGEAEDEPTPQKGKGTRKGEAEGESTPQPPNYAPQREAPQPAVPPEPHVFPKAVQEIFAEAARMEQQNQQAPQTPPGRGYPAWFGQGSADPYADWMWGREWETQDLQPQYPGSEILDWSDFGPSHDGRAVLRYEHHYRWPVERLPRVFETEARHRHQNPNRKMHWR